jgi:hypothetical protein
VQDFIERAARQPTGKAELIDENDRLKTAIAARDREVARYSRWRAKHKIVIASLMPLY